MLFLILTAWIENCFPPGGGNGVKNLIKLIGGVKKKVVQTRKRLVEGDVDGGIGHFNLPTYLSLS